MEDKRYLKIFDSQADYESQKDSVMGVPHVVLLEDTKELIFKPSEGGGETDPFNGHEYVDLGLPSGTLWAKYNVGAESEEDYGLYFAWGGTEGATYEEANDPSQFLFGTGGAGVGSLVPYTTDGTNYTKYNSEDGKTILNLEDDAAHVHMGGDWHMPTKEQYEELTANTTSIWTTVNGVKGRLFTAPNGNSLFVPSAGSAGSGYVSDVGSGGYAWSSSVREEYLGYAWFLAVDSYGVYVSNYGRDVGHSVRGVVG